MPLRSRRSPIVRVLLDRLALIAVIELVAIGFRYLVQILIARLAGAEGYGAYTYALTWASTLAIPAGLGLSVLVIRFVPTYTARGEIGHLRALLTFTRRWTGTTSLLVALGTAAVVATAMDSGDARSTLIIACASIPLFAITTLQAETLRGTGRVLTSRLLPNLVQPTLILTATALVYQVKGELTAPDAAAALVAALAAAAAVQALTVRYVLAVPKSVPSVTPDAAGWLRTSLQFLWIKLGQLVLNTSDILAIGLVLGPLQAGIYAAATKTAVVTQTVTQAVNLAVPPEVARQLALGQPARAEQVVRRSARFAFLPTLLSGVAVIVCAEQLLGLFGEEFRSGALALSVLVLGRLVTSWTGPVGSVLSVTGHQRYSVWTYSGAALAQVVLLIALIPPYGIVGAAIASTTAMTLWNVVLAFLVVRRVGIRIWPLRPTDRKEPA